MSNRSHQQDDEELKDEVMPLSSNNNNVIKERIVKQKTDPQQLYNDSAGDPSTIRNGLGDLSSNYNNSSLNNNRLGGGSSSNNSNISENKYTYYDPAIVKI